MQKLVKANLVELPKTEKVGNIEKKLYCASATRFVPQQYFEFKPRDANPQGAFEIYSDIQKNILAKVSAFSEVPKGVRPIDFALFANMQAFAQVIGGPTTQAKLVELEHKLAKFQEHSKYF